MFLFLYESHLTVGLCIDNQMSLLSHRTSLEHIISQLRLQLRTLYVPPPFFVSLILQHTSTYVFIKYLYPKTHTIYKHIFTLCVPQNVTAGAQSTSTTHFSCSSKCRRTSLYKSYHRVFDFVKSKITG